MQFSGWEKLGFGLLVAAWVAFGSNFAGNMLVHSQDLEAPAYKVEVAETPGEADAADAPVENALTMLASVDVARGEKLFSKCKACHTKDEGGKHGIGPNLWDVVGRAKGGTDFDKYSSALQEKGGDWTYEALDAFLLKPKEYIPGTKMSFPGLKKASDRAEMIVLLRSLSASPKPLP